MSEGGISLRFALQDLAYIFEKKHGIKNVAITSDQDVENAIIIVLGLMGDGTYWEGQERPCARRVRIRSCKLENDTAVVSFECEDISYTQEFLTCVKKIESYITRVK